MDIIINFVTQITGDETTGRWLINLLIATAVFSLCIAFYFLLGGYFDPVRKRFFSVTGTQQHRQQSTFAQDTVRQLGDFFIIEKDEKLSNDRERLLHAGFHSKDALSNYYGFRILLTLGCPTIVFLLTYIFPGLSVRNIVLSVIAGFAFGYIAPSFYLDKKLEKRQRIIRNGFPDAIDQLIVCTEAGLGLDAGLQRVGRDTALSNPVMGYELGQVSAELRAGIDRDTALKNLVKRTGVDEIRGLVAAISQSMRFGSSIADTLRVYAEDLRDKRMQRAEEEAAKLGIKMLFPLAFCFFPGIFIVILGPAVITIKKALDL